MLIKKSSKKLIYENMKIYFNNSAFKEGKFKKIG